MVPAIPGTPWNLGAISQAEFTGISLHSVLQLAVLDQAAIEVRFTGYDQGLVKSGKVEPYARSLPIEAALHPDTLYVWEMINQLLTADHGFPLRLIVPRWYGMASVKWLREVTVFKEPFNGFFQTREYVYSGEVGTEDNTPVTQMRVRSLIIEPGRKTMGVNESVTISGLAWTGMGAVNKVELSFDDGASWTSAEITPSNSAYRTCRWHKSWKPEKIGPAQIISRATNSEGNVQPIKSRWYQGGYGNNFCHKTNMMVIA